MKKSWKLVVLLLLSAAVFAFADTQAADWFGSTQLPPLPDSLGVAGAYSGVSNGALIVAGGANFPRPLFKDGKKNPDAQKVWHDEVYVLQSADSDWIQAGSLPFPMAYGASVATDDGFICIGGSDANQCYSDVFKISWENQTLQITPMPSLPYRCANLSAAKIGSVIYVIGGQNANDSSTSLNSFLAIDLSQPASQWQQLESLPAAGRVLSVAAAQSGAFYVVSGAELYKADDGSVKRNYLTDGYCFIISQENPLQGKWKKIADIPAAVCAAPTPAYSLGQSHFMIFGGDHGKYASRTMELADNHPGFSKDIYAYHTITDTWTKTGTCATGLVTTAGVLWQDKYIIPSGEIRPGTRSPEILSVSRKPFVSKFSVLDYTTLIVYLLALVGIGVYFAKRGKTTDDYFRGGGRLPWWASGLSIFATLLSAITFMAIPAKAFATNWAYLLQNLPIFLLAPVIIAFYLPIYRRLNVSSAYEYLEKRFNIAVRFFGSAIFILFHIGRMAIVLYLPAVALSSVTPLSIFICLVLMGILCTVYTFLGGIEAVVWTDSLQAVVLLIGAMLSIVVIVLGCNGGLSGFISTAMADNKIDVLNISGGSVGAAAWIIFIGGIFNTIGPYSSDQTVVQRYMTSKTEKQAAKSIWTNAIISMPASVLFFAVGTALYVYYKSNPQNLVPGMKTDTIFPLFIVQQLPIGLTGLVLAGLFAACQSTLSSSLNSVSTVIVTDFYKRLKPNSKDAVCLLLAKVLTVILGIAATIVAMFMATSNIQSLWDVYLKILSLFGGGLAGLFMLGMFTKQANGLGAIAGAIGSAVILYWVQQYTNITFFLYSFIGILVCVVLGLIVSMIFRGEKKDLQGLTFYTVGKAKEE